MGLVATPVDMANETSTVEMTFESNLKYVEVAEDVVRRVCTTAGFEEEEEHKLEMAVHESLINAIWHGNKNDPAKQVGLKFQIFGDRLEIRVRDQGNGFDPDHIPDPLEESNLLKVSGRGIFLIRAYVDEFRVSNVAGSGTEVTLVKRFNHSTKSHEGGMDREHEGYSTSN
jgi:serine/threonine-protein kinase RsbW